LLQRDKDVAGAKSVLEESAKANPDDARILNALGRIQLESKEQEKALATFESIHALGAADTELLTVLAQLYDAAKNPEKQAGILAELAARMPDNFAVRLQLAKLYHSLPRQAERWAREALFVDVGSEDARGILLAALKAQKKDAEAEKVEKRYR
jgi:predicted Zn-dependent protease